MLSVNRNFILFVFVVFTIFSRTALAQIADKDDKIPLADQLVRIIIDREKKLHDLFQHISLQGDMTTVASGVDEVDYRVQYTLIRSSELVKYTYQMTGSISTRTFTKDSPTLQIKQFDGQEYWFLALPHHSKRTDHRPELTIYRDHEKALRLASQTGVTDLMVLGMQSTNRPYAECLPEATSLVVNQYLEKINEYQTIILIAKLPEGRLRLWLSSEHGYAIVQHELLTKSGDRIKLSPDKYEAVPQGFTQNNRFTVQNMLQINDVWLPTEIKCVSSARFPNNKQLQGHSTWTFDEIILDSPAQEDRTFTLPTLPVGTKVSIDGDVNPNGSTRSYNWDGENYIPEKSIFKSK